VIPCRTGLKMLCGETTSRRVGSKSQDRVTVYSPKARILQDRQDAKKTVTRTSIPCREPLPDADMLVYQKTGSGPRGPVRYPNPWFSKDWIGLRMSCRPYKCENYLQKGDQFGKKSFSYQIVPHADSLLRLKSIFVMDSPFIHCLPSSCRSPVP
jgi:hypothetical protein